MLVLDRRTLLIAGFGLAVPPLPVLAAPPQSRLLRFAVYRNGRQIGEHELAFAGPADAPRVSAQARMSVKLGPVTVFRYRHTSEEVWAGERLRTLSTQTNSNGKLETVEAERTGGGLVIQSTKTGRVTAPAATAPLSHWNAAVLDGPLFNPQTGRLLKVSAANLGRDQAQLADGSSISGVHWRIRGEAEIDNWYDAAGAWAALRGRLEDKSLLEYRRL